MNLIYLMIIEFIMAHEAAHIADGHLGYLFSKNNKIKSFDDLESNFEKQCLEVIADTFAASHCLEIWFRFVNNKHPIIPEKLCSENHIFNVFVFALYFLKRVLTTSTPANQTIEDDYKSKYPISAFRWRIIIERLYKELNGRGLINDSFQDFYLKFIYNHVDAFELCLSNVSEKVNEGFNREFERSQSNNYRDYARSLSEGYEKISPLLQPFRTKNIHPF